MTYQISCSRSPCKDRFNHKDSLSVPTPGPDPPALYFGETSRTPFLRGQGHNKDYIKKADGSTMWRHTRDVHNGEIGQDNGLLDYRMIKLDTLPKPLDRIAKEGILIGELDNMEDNNSAISLNSKRDFQQANTVTISYNRGAKKS